MIVVGGKAYELVQEHKDGWKPDAFRERYSEVLDRYDYIVGDWGYNQLRLKGFFREGNHRATKDTSIASLQEYVMEYCNFGCAYFVLERAAGKHAAPEGTAPADSPALPAADEDDIGSVTVSSAGGRDSGFSDRKPYSWRENQSPYRMSGKTPDRFESSFAPDKGAAASGKSDASPQRFSGSRSSYDRSRGDESRPSNGPPGGRAEEGRMRGHDSAAAFPPKYSNGPPGRAGADVRGDRSGSRPPSPDPSGNGRERSYPAPGNRKPGKGQQHPQKQGAAQDAPARGGESRSNNANALRGGGRHHDKGGPNRFPPLPDAAPGPGAGPPRDRPPHRHPQKPGTKML